MKNKETKQLIEKLTYKTEHTSKKKSDCSKEAFEFCNEYKKYLNSCKTERLSVITSQNILLKNGFCEFSPKESYKAGDKVFVNVKKKALIAAVIGKQATENGLIISVAHIDAPRLDLKPNPLYEDSEIALFKTHYYGGIRKYQWAATPLSLHGILYKKDNTAVSISIGEEENEPVFCVSDLLPHLAKEQEKRLLGEGIKGEELNIIVGSEPFDNDPEVKEAIKLYTLKLLYDKYGITEQDFTRAEIEAVPAFKARDVGFDCSLIGAYGQDDRVCAFTSLMALVETAQPNKTTVCVLADKEETGSEGNTGLHSSFLANFIEQLCVCTKSERIITLKNSLCLSCDVNAAFDPTFPDVLDKRNAAKLNHGVIISKYTGHRGKGDTNDASAETMSRITSMLNKADIPWQVGELGKVDLGGGGTVAKYIANIDIDVVDLGVPLLSMHSPFELSAKNDVYAAFLALKTFFQEQ